MADIDMPDAGPSAPAGGKGKATVKSSKAGAGGGSEEKKRFEVKKVKYPVWSPIRPHSWLIGCIVERCRSMGLGHCGRQLRYLPESHHGSV